MKLILATLLVWSQNAFAHVEPGVYKGTKSDGQECAMAAGLTYFENNTPHPLNERIPIAVEAQNFIVNHPSSIDSKESSVGFNHDLFQGLLPNSTGANALEIEMEHSDSYEGPRSFVYISHNWKTKERLSYRCSNLKHTK